MPDEPTRLMAVTGSRSAHAPRTIPLTPSTQRTRPRWWLGVAACALWALTMLCLAVVPWLDELLRQAGRPDLAQFIFPDVAIPVLAVVSSVTVGAVVAARRPAHPVGWLLLGIALSLTGTAATAQYFVYGLLVRPGALPAARYALLYQPATAFTALTLIGFVLLLTPTGALPSPRWRWPARVLAATPAVLVLVSTLAGGPNRPALPGPGRPLRPPRPRRGPGGRQPGRLGGHRGGPGGGGRVAGGAVRPRPRGRAAAAALGGAGRGAGGAGRRWRPVQPGGRGVGRRDPVQRGRRLLPGGPAGGHRGGGAALPAV